MFRTIARGELSVEGERISLAKCRNFSPIRLFDHINVSHYGVTSVDVIRVLQEAGIDCSSNDGYLLIRQYDCEGKAKLNYPEFSNLILPATDVILREFVLASSGDITKEALKCLVSLMI